MLYITRDKNIQQIYIQRQGNAALPIGLSAVSTSDMGNGVSFVVNKAEISGRFYRLTIGLPDEGFHEGEWEWSLVLADGATICGLMQVTATAEEGIQYNKTINYKQYGE